MITIMSMFLPLNIKGQRVCMNYYHLLLPQSPDIDPCRVLAGQDQTQVLLLLQVGHPHTVAELGEEYVSICLFFLFIL